MRRRRYAYGYQGNALQQPEPKMNFFQAIFSFVFGDGDPNLDWEERRWQTVGFCSCFLSNRSKCQPDDTCCCAGSCFCAWHTKHICKALLESTAEGTRLHCM